MMHQLVNFSTEHLWAIGYLPHWRQKCLVIQDPVSVDGGSSHSLMEFQVGQEFS